MCKTGHWGIEEWVGVGVWAIDGVVCNRVITTGYLTTCVGSGSGESSRGRSSNDRQSQGHCG